ncbi:hypothetical protein Sru01_60900 [Sphaerisporangium rufum]|uniref:Uncharacterized protein n=1 Tax=Sphaerisporangium rufum TaxID=1381558 RepID=A0A919R8C9_9ACTN|nr:hypothetical protein [Sphaerisporangium rufum]GII81108.1 hypothetical protein Sru01_60900 [Sphaerisporangium rufum]
MSIKDAALRYATAVENELIQIRADQMEQGQELTERINGVSNSLKELREEMGDMRTKVGGLGDSQRQMLEILIDIQRRLA